MNLLESTYNCHDSPGKKIKRNLNNRDIDRFKKKSDRNQGY